MTKTSGSSFAPWKLDERIKEMLKGSCFYNLTNFSRYISKSDYLTKIQKLYDIYQHVFKVGQHNLYFGLQDVFALSGLPVDGRPLVCHDHPDNTVLCMKLLGADDQSRRKTCGFLSRTFLIDNFEKVPQEASQDQLAKYVRAFLLFLIGGLVVTNSDKPTKYPIYLLNFLEDVNPRALNSFAWGAAAHAQLHDMLSRGRKNLNGPSWMLELFFFERIPQVAKSYFNLSSGPAQAIPQNRKIPLFLSWTPFMLKPSQNPRKFIDMSMINDEMTDEQICWNPYVAYTNYEHQRIFHSKIPLFCYDIIHYHRPDKVPRQLCVYNPKPLEDEVRYQSKSAKGHTVRNLPERYAASLKIWEDKRYCETMCVRDNDVEFALPPEPTSDAVNDVNSGEYDRVDHEVNNGAVVLTNESESENLHDTTHVVNSGENDGVDYDLDNDSDEDENIRHTICGSFGISSSGTTSTPHSQGAKNAKDPQQPINQHIITQLFEQQRLQQQEAERIKRIQVISPLVQDKSPPQGPIEGEHSKETHKGKRPMTIAELKIAKEAQDTEEDWLEAEKQKEKAQLAKKRKRDSGELQKFRSPTQFKKLVKYGKLPSGTVLNEPTLGMIFINDYRYNRQDFVSVEELPDMTDETLFGVQLIFFRHHNGPGITHLARTFCSCMVAEIDKRNAKSPPKKLRLNPKLGQQVVSHLIIR